MKQSPRTPLKPSGRNLTYLLEVRLSEVEVFMFHTLIEKFNHVVRRTA